MLKDLLSPRRVFEDLRPAPKAELLAEMARRLHALGELGDDPATIAEMLARREEIVSTGVREGIAFPHAFTPGLGELRLTIGVVREGTDWRSLDAKPVEFVLLILGPPSPRHLRVLARLSRIVSAEGMLERMRQAPDAGALIELLLEADAAVAAEFGYPGE